MCGRALQLLGGLQNGRQDFLLCHDLSRTRLAFVSLDHSYSPIKKATQIWVASDFEKLELQMWFIKQITWTAGALACAVWLSQLKMS